MAETKKKKDKNPEGGSMPLSGHLRELRNRIIVILVVFFALTVAGLSFAPKFVGILMDMGESSQYRFIYISPQELLIEYFSVALIFGLCCSLPVILYQIFAFISPGLREKEKMFFMLAMIFGLICAGIGVLFAYKLLLPFMLRFLAGIGAGSGIEAAISVQNYVSFLMTIFIIFAVIFELPVVSVLLTQLGLLKSAWMKAATKVVIVAIFFIAAVITPPDITSQIMVAIPMCLLYVFSTWLCSLVEKVSGKADEEDEEEDGEEEE